MFTPPYLPCTAEFALDDVSYRGDEALAILAHASPSTADCPSCGRSSYRVHSRYRRRVADLPIQGMPVKFDMTVRRFRCRTTGCPQRIFSERFQKTMGHYARETLRRNATLENVAFALGGKPAERITHVLGMATSDSTLLRRIRYSPCTAETSAQIIGIDDFAFKKGNTYGTIIVNHQSGRPMDMLPDREAQTVEKWAREHPEIEIVSRDRSGAYKSGIDAGAPQAVQVADRFHLLVNAREALQRVVERKSSALGQAAHSVITPEQDDTPPDMKAVTGISGKPKDPRAQALSACRRKRRYQRYFEVVQLRAQGISISGIARALRISRMTIRCWLRASTFPERAPRRPVTRRRSIRPYETYLLQRISEGMRTSTLLYQEIRDRGFRGSYRTVRRWASDQGVRQPCSKANSVAIPAEWRSPRAVTWLLIKRSDELSEQDGRFVTALLECDTVIAAARESVRDFVRIVRERDHAKFDSWIEKAQKTELGGFVDCIKQDHDIIDAALRLPWSNGPVEGHVNRIKAIKRQMYGRANFDLLRRRVLHVA
jgi:transposase